LNNICITDTISIETTDPYGSLHRKIKEEMTKIKKANQKLPFYITSLLNSAKPADRDNIIRSLSNNGWTLSAISRSVELSRERVRQICETPIDGPMPPDFTNPTPPMYPAKVEREFVEPSPEILEYIGNGTSLLGCGDGSVGLATGTATTYTNWQYGSVFLTNRYNWQSNPYCSLTIRVIE